MVVRWSMSPSTLDPAVEKKLFLNYVQNLIRPVVFYGHEASSMPEKDM